MPSWPPPIRSAGSSCAVQRPAYLWLRSRPGHQSWARRLNRPATPPGALCAASPGSASRLRAGRKDRGCNLGSSREPAAGWAGRERPSGFAAGARATPSPGTSEDSGRGGIGVGGGLWAASAGGGCVRAPAPLTPHALSLGGKARGRWCPCRWAWKPLRHPCRALAFPPCGSSSPSGYPQAGRLWCRGGGRTNVGYGSPGLPPVS